MYKQKKTPPPGSQATDNRYLQDLQTDFIFFITELSVALLVRTALGTSQNLNTDSKQYEDKFTFRGKYVDITIIVIVTNTLVVLATFIATLYRIKIERDQIQTVKKTAHAKECLESLRKYIKAERNSIGKLDEKELNEFFDYLEKLGEC